MTLDEPDLALLLDESFGDGPPLPAPADRLAAGRTALRRRRRVGVAGSAAAVAVILGGVAVLGPGGNGPETAEPLAPGPTTSSSEGTIDEAQLEVSLDRLAALAQVRARHLQTQQLVSKQFPAALDQDGTLVVKDGWEVTQQVPDPVGLTPPEASLGVVVTDGRRTRWMLLTLELVKGTMSAGASADDPGKGYSRFEDWLASMVAISGGAEPDALVVVGAGDQVAAGPGSTLVDVQEIDVIEGYTSPGDRIAEVRRDGRTWFVVIRGHGLDAETIPVDAEVLPDATLDALLTYLAQQADSGEGVR
ncbi:hypothetical protein [Nocardioides dilutus]